MKKFKFSEVILLAIMIVFLMYLLFYGLVILWPKFDIEFEEGSWYFSDTENNLEIELIYDGSVPVGVMTYEGKEFEFELHTKAASAQVWIKGENDSESDFWLVGDCKIKANGDIQIKNAECIGEPYINFKNKRIIFKRKQE